MFEYVNQNPISYKTKQSNNPNFVINDLKWEYTSTGSLMKFFHRFPSCPVLVIPNYLKMQNKSTSVEILKGSIEILNSFQNL